MSNTIQYKHLSLNEIRSDMLDSFVRKQEVFKCYRVIDGVEMLIDNPFVEDWSIEQNRKIVSENFTRAIETGGCVIAALDGERVIGFASFFGELIGSEKQYVNLDMLHISREYRRRGIGKELWRRISAEARSCGYKKFYISAHSSEESQAFYRAVGCVSAAEIIPELFEAEPFDVHMEYGLHNKLGNRVTLRLEKKSDYETVEQITYRAFCNAPPTGADDDGMEALLARKLRTCTAFVPELDYIAELNGTIIGNIMYTRSKIVGDNNEWETLTFGPVSVLPQYQRDGVGSALIQKTLEVARELGYRAVLIFGHESYYPRFGFKPASEYVITTADGKNFPAFMALPLYDGALDGVNGRLIYDEVYDTLDRAESDALNAKLAAPMDIDEYISALPENYQSFLYQVRDTIRTAAPGATEKISWQMPTFWRGQNLIHFAAFKQHIGIYPGAEAMEHFAPRLQNYKTSKGAVQFPYLNFGNEQLALISEIAAWCAEHNAK
jgi:predicted N-acetyltransferase YhbS/uncharacterized protein YdhG (YjbR/CyaY superfamily)